MVRNIREASKINNWDAKFGFVCATTRTLGWRLDVLLWQGSHTSVGKSLHWYNGFWPGKGIATCHGGTDRSWFGCEKRVACVWVYIEKTYVVYEVEWQCIYLVECN